MPPSGCVGAFAADEGVKVRSSTPCGSREVTAVKRKVGRPRREPTDLLTSSSSSERLKRATRRSTVLRVRSNHSSIVGNGVQCLKRTGDLGLLTFGCASEGKHLYL